MAARAGERSVVRQVESAASDASAVTPAIDRCHFLLAAVDRERDAGDRLTVETAAAIAHQIRNPMAGIRGAVEVIGSELAHDKHELADVVHQITARIDELDRSLDAMLTYLHPASPKLHCIELGALLERILVDEARPAPLRDLDIRLTCDDVVLAVDSEQLSRTIVDLLTNSAEALPAARGSVELTLSKAPPFATITLTDRAGGIPAELVPRVCEAFFTTKPRALGLGLTNARKVAQAHGGDLSLRTADAVTEVRLRLPLDPKRSA